MRFEEALAAMRAGKRVRRPCWIDGLVFVKRAEGISSEYRGHWDDSPHVEVADLLEEDWEAAEVGCSPKAPAGELLDLERRVVTLEAQRRSAVQANARFEAQVWKRLSALESATAGDAPATPERQPEAGRQRRGEPYWIRLDDQERVNLKCACGTLNDFALPIIRGDRLVCRTCAGGIETPDWALPGKGDGA